MRPEPSYWRRLRRAVAVLTVAVAAHIWLVRAPQPAEPEGRRIETAGLLPAPVSPGARDVRVTADLITSPVDPPVGTSGQGVVPVVLRTAVGRSIAPSVSVRDSARAELVGRVSEATEERDEPPPARVVEHAEVESRADTVQTEVLQPLSGKPLILAALPSSVSPAALRAHPATERGTSERASEIREQTEIIREVLNRYTHSFETMDLGATKAVYPSVDDRALQKAYRALDGQQVRLSNCGVSIEGPDANARCRGTATYRPKVGPRTVQLTDLEWMFRLARGDAGWQIVNANARIR